MNRQYSHPSNSPIVFRVAPIIVIVVCYAARHCPTISKRSSHRLKITTRRTFQIATTTTIIIIQRRSSRARCRRQTHSRRRRTLTTTTTITTWTAIRQRARSRRTTTTPPMLRRRDRCRRRLVHLLCHVSAHRHCPPALSRYKIIAVCFSVVKCFKCVLSESRLCCVSILF